MKHIKLFEQFTKEGKFYLAVDDYAKLFDNEIFLKEGKLKGLTGISSSKDIVAHLGSICDVFVEMDESAVMNLNKLVKVDYKDADLLVKDNFKLLKRIMGNGLNHSNNQYFMELIFANNINLDFIDEIDSALCFFLRSSVRVMLKKIGVPNINSINDICMWLLKDYKEDFDYLHKIISDYVKHIIVNYREEEEWMVLDEYFIIPPKSKLYIDIECITDNVGEENIKETKKDIKKKSKEFLSKYEIILGTFAETEVL